MPAYKDTMGTDDLVGALVGGKYRVERRLGHGGMGSVWIAVQESLDRRVALKVVRARTDDEARQRFAREARIAASLACPHVVVLFDFGEHEGAPFIAMELLDGETLRARIVRAPLAEDEALRITRDIVCGLRSAHAAGIVHRDLKPENVVLVADRDRGVVAKLLDFGIAKARVVDGDEPGLTSAGFVVGTPGYVAPEVVLEGKSDDPRVDLYAVGVVLYEMLAGAPPFTAATALGLLMAHASDRAPDVRATRADVSAPVAALIGRLLAKDPAARPADAAALIVELDGLRAASASTEAVAVPRSATTTPRSGEATLRAGDRGAPRVAVQPFAAAGGDEHDVMFAEAVSEDVLTALSSFKAIAVVAQASMWRPGGRDSDALAVGRSVGASFVVQGSVRRAGVELRVTAKLVDAATGAQLWAHRFDRPLQDVFAVQDEITAAIVARVAGRVETAGAEHARRKAPHELAAYDWLARGRALHHRRTAADNEASRKALDKAIEVDPEYAQAHAWRACALGQQMMMGSGDYSLAPEIERAVVRALQLDETDAECHRLAAEIAAMVPDLDKARRHQERASALNPSDARIIALGGELEMFAGRFAAAAIALERAVTLDPLAPQGYLRNLAWALYGQRDLAGARRVLAQLDDTRSYMLALGAAVATLQDDQEAAASWIARMRAAPPGVPLTKVMASFEPSVRPIMREGFERAGLLAKDDDATPPPP